jgi:hypothetical protein
VEKSWQLLNYGEVGVPSEQINVVEPKPIGKR